MIADRLGVRIPIMVLLCLVQPSHARPALPRDHESRVGECIRRAADGRQWLERTLWGLRDQEAGWIGAEILNRNGSHDLGPLQVNSFWIPKLAAMIDRSPDTVRTWLTHDPCFNVQAARWIFLSELSATRDYWKAIGVYHSPTLWRQRRYSRLVAAKLVRRFGSTVIRRDGVL